MLPVESQYRRSKKCRKKICTKRKKRRKEKKSRPGKVLLAASILNESLFHSHFSVCCCSPVTVVYLPSDHLYFSSHSRSRSFSLFLPLHPKLLPRCRFSRNFFSPDIPIVSSWCVCVVASFSLHTCRNFLRLKYDNDTYTHPRRRRRRHNSHTTKIYTMLIANGDLFMQATTKTAAAAAATSLHYVCT